MSMAPRDAWGRSWGDPAYGQHPQLDPLRWRAGFDFWGRQFGHPQFGQALSAHVAPAPASAWAGGWEQLPGTGPEKPLAPSIPQVRGAAEGAVPGLPGVFDPTQRAHALPPSWNPEGLDVQLAPFKARDKMAPASRYYQPPNVLQFQEAAGVVGRAQIEPPDFDMRPDLRNAFGNRPEISIPIWRESAFGQGLYLFIKIHGALSEITAKLRVFSIQFGDIGNEDLITALQQPEEITQEFFDGALGVILSWPTPLYRFWRVELRFDQLSGTLNDLGTVNPLRYSIGVY